MSKDAFFTGKLKLNNEPYAIVKIAGIKLCESYNLQYGYSHGIDYRSVMPRNLYGPDDNYHPEISHVIPALIRRFHEAKISNAPEVLIWGTGTPRREFLYVDDMASASVFVMELSKVIYDEHAEPMQSHINVGSGSDITILEPPKAVAKVINYNGAITLDTNRHDGASRKWINSSALNRLGWQPKFMLTEGLSETYQVFLETLR